MAEKRNRAISGRLYKRDTKGRELPATSRKHGVFWLQYDVNGKRFRERLADPVTGEAVTGRERAEQIRKSKMAPFSTAETLERVKTLRAAVADAEEQHVEAVERARTKAPLADAWVRYLAAPNRPDTGDSTLEQYNFQWTAFTRWMAVQHPDTSALCQVAPALAGEYVLYLWQRGLSPGTINKHVRLLRLVFSVLGRAEGMAANPFADIGSKSVVQTHRREFSWDVLSRVRDAASGEMKLLFFLGIYTGQRLGGCCLLAWDQVDLLRRPGWILVTSAQDRPAAGKAPPHTNPPFVALHHRHSPPGSRCAPGRGSGDRRACDCGHVPVLHPHRPRSPREGRGPVTRRHTDMCRAGRGDRRDRCR